MSEPDREAELMAAAARIDPEAFRACEGTTFEVGDDADRIPLRLDAVDGVQSARGMLRFSLLFHGPADRLMPQGIYVFHHATLGAMMLFIVPVIGSNAERIIYEASFTRPLPPAATA